MITRYKKNKIGSINHKQLFCFHFSASTKTTTNAHFLHMRDLPNYNKDYKLVVCTISNTRTICILQASNQYPLLINTNNKFLCE